MDLFEWATAECDHLPVRQRVFKDDQLICGKCGGFLRNKVWASGDVIKFDRESREQEGR